MEWTALFTDTLKLSPFVAALLFFLMKVWKSMEVKDQALMSTMKDNQAQQLLMQEKHITAQNNSADANRQLASAIGDLKDHLSDKLDEVKSTLPVRNGTIRRHPSTPESSSKPA
ncbi:hypothetical protein G8759_31350 [Spirosoma aureum]|uniref:Uncharacterized protein n=1 Tax=Spirosoma aureum TaxID=2692134 RepID=A0A6G9AWF8_9BACT|nr:hypothetical protein [Spirosoma aureum]QIP16821.1 hypothetical protein G8759_31350 [Spirosoma aureum]